MTYEEQCKIQELNKQIIEDIKASVKPDDFIDFYKNHNQKQTMEHYGIRTLKQLRKILEIFNYDFSYQKGLNRGKPSTRSHESYIAGGIKSAETQKATWEAKTDLEKQQWSEKQKIAHDTEAFKAKIRKINLDYYAGLSEEEKLKISIKKSKTAKAKWAALTKEEQEQIMSNRFKNGRTYNSKNSQPNIAFASLLTDNDINFVREFCLDRKIFDFKVDNTLIEINPSITHNVSFTPFSYKIPLDKYYHRDKSEIAKKYNFKCIQVFDWDDQEKIVKLLLSRNTIYARDCLFMEVKQSLAKDFLNKNHLQGYAKASINFGLFYQGNLVSVMTFDKPRYNKKYDFELIRYCSSYNIIGGSEKLFKHFLKEYPNKTIISYCDLSKFSGATYEKLGFNLLKKPAPSKHWVNIHTKQHFTDNLLRKQGFSRLVNHCDASQDNLPTANNSELMLMHNFVEVYDCGQATYVYEQPTN